MNTTKPARKKRNTITRDQLRQHLEAMLPENMRIISRHYGPLNEICPPGTLANHDSLGTGISERITIKGKVFYGREATIDWLVDHAGE